MPSHGQKVQGSERTLSNGAKGHKVWIRKKNGEMGERFVITNGAPASYLAGIRGSGKRRQISEEKARAAFKRAYKPGNFKTPQAAKAARTRDLNYPSEVRTTTTYLRNPRKWDYPGVDLGNKVRKPMTEAQKAALARGRAALKAKRQAGGYWW